MFEVRIHGRGGQGVVTAAEMMSIAAFFEGKHAQAFPSFGSERTGAPVVSFCRIDDKPIRTREPIAAPDSVIVQDPTLLHDPAITNGLRSGSYLLVNTSRGAEELALDALVDGIIPSHVVTVAASEIARAHLGRPLPNAVLLGGFAAMTEQLRIESVERAIHEKFAGSVADANCAAARVAYDAVRREIRDLAHAAAD
jgi:pyruvate ferredoxin oxidoreductase gamma subunit